MYENIREWRDPPAKLREGMTFDDVEAFLAERKAEALRIDPAICEGACWSVYVTDPYSLLVDLPERERCIGTDVFVRNPGGVWVWFGDLPEGVLEAAQARAEKEEAAALQQYHLGRSEPR